MFSRRFHRHFSFSRRPAVVQWCSHRFGATAAAALRAAPPQHPEDAVGRLAFDASKAGLQNIDKAHVQEVIHAATKGSAFFKSEQRKEAARATRHDALILKQHAFRRLPKTEQKAWAVKAEAVASTLEATRDFTRRFIHVDLDMFYAAVEAKVNPELRDRPFAVGSFAMLATSNYIARQYGVRSSMPGFIAKKLCPKLWIQPLHFDLYRAEAAAVRAIAATYDPHYVTVGLDELTMDVTEFLRRHNGDGTAIKTKANPLTAEDVCAEFRARVEEATQLTCSGGVAHTAAFAKLASNVHKPNGQHTVALRTRDEVLRHVRDMPVRDVPGVGAATEHQLRALGIHTCSDFLTHKAELCYLFREKTFAFYLSAGLGLVRTHVDRAIAERAAIDDAQKCTEAAVHVRDSEASKKGSKKTLPISASPRVESHTAAPRPTLQKSTGKSITVSRGLPSPEAFRMRLRELVKGAHAVLVQQGTGTRRICFSTIDHSFTERSYSTTLSNLANNYQRLLKAVATLAEPFVLRHREFRLIGVNFGGLQPMPVAAANTHKRTSPGASSKRKPTTVQHHYPKRRVPALGRGDKDAHSSCKRKTTTTKKQVSRELAPSGQLRRSKQTPKMSARPKKHRVSSVRHV